MRILLSEGSGLTSRQVAGRLGALGHRVEILSSTPVCLSRFTRTVHAIHAVPRFGDDPFGWLDAAERIAKERAIDLLFPTQEQVTVALDHTTRRAKTSCTTGGNHRSIHDFLFASYAMEGISVFVIDRP